MPVIRQESRDTRHGGSSGHEGFRDRVKKILIIRLSSIGDIVLTTPVVRELAEAFPGSVIDYCTKTPFTVLLSGNRHINELFTVDCPPAGSYDLVVDLQNNIRSKRIIRNVQAGAVKRYRKKNWKKLLLVRARIDVTGGYRSVVDRYRDALHEFGIQPDERGCELFPSSADRIFASAATGTGLPVLALCFGAMHASKRYPPEKFAGVLSMLFKSMDLKVILLGGKDDVTHAADIMNALPETYRMNVTDLSGKSSLMQSAAVLERADAVLSNDTGLMHMASSFGKKIFLIFGSSVQAFGFLPYHVPFELFENAVLRCRPCSHVGRDHCPEGHFSCMNDIREDEIAAKIAGYLKSLRS